MAKSAHEMRFKLCSVHLPVIPGFPLPLRARQSIAPPVTLALLGTLYILEPALVRAVSESSITVVLISVCTAFSLPV
jgi:hypothetical protein